jgi:hypothetical protein
MLLWLANHSFWPANDRDRTSSYYSRIGQPEFQEGKAGHSARMQESGCFRFVRECLLHHQDEGGAERIVGILLSQGCVESLVKLGLSEKDLQIDRGGPPGVGL